VGTPGSTTAGCGMLTEASWHEPAQHLHMALLIAEAAAEGMGADCSQVSLVACTCAAAAAAVAAATTPPPPCTRSTPHGREHWRRVSALARSYGCPGSITQLLAAHTEAWRQAGAAAAGSAMPRPCIVQAASPGHHHHPHLSQNPRLNL
jgi:hypothetical protein